VKQASSVTPIRIALDSAIRRLNPEQDLTQLYDTSGKKLDKILDSFKVGDSTVFRNDSKLLKFNSKSTQA
jgi:hypothetical protein